MNPITIAIDAMGGDHGPRVTVPAAWRALAEYKNLHLILTGDQSVLNQALEQQAKASADDYRDRITVRHTSEVVAMDESPALALRHKKDSSMRVAINLVKEGAAQACVSAGNTGALMATGRFVLKTIPGVDRPAIIAPLPTIIDGKEVYMLDLGANVECTVQNLLEFAIMGSCLVSAVKNEPSPTVGLLNVGVEDIKGNDLVKEAALKLQANPYVNYVGYIEGDEIYNGEVQIIVCDGFVGNVALKSSEGVARFLRHYITKAFKQNLLTRMAALIAVPILRSALHKVDPRRYNGASLVGLQGIVIKSHGGADELAFSYAIDEAVTEVEHNVPDRIGAMVAKILSSEVRA